MSRSSLSVSPFEVIETADRSQLHHALVLHLHLGADIPQLDHVRLCHVLRSSVSCQFICARIACEAGEMRLFHRHLRSGHHQIVDVDRKPGEHAQRIEIGHQRNGDENEADTRGNGDAQDTNHAAMPARGLERALRVAAARCPIGMRGVLVSFGCDHTVHAKPGIRLHPGKIPEIISRPHAATCGSNMAPTRQQALGR